MPRIGEEHKMIKLVGFCMDKQQLLDDNKLNDFRNNLRLKNSNTPEKYGTVVFLITYLSRRRWEKEILVHSLCQYLIPKTRID